MANRVLRPLEYGDLLDELFDLYKSKFLLFAGIAGVVFLPVNFVLYMVAGEYGQIIAAILLWPLNYIVMAATTYAVSRCYLGETTTIADAYKAIKGRAFLFVLTLLVAGLIIGCGMLLLIVPGIIFSLWYAFLSEVFILEGLSGKDARNRSKQLAEGQWGRIIVVGFIVSIIGGIGAMIIATPFTFIAGFLGAMSGMDGLTGFAGAVTGFGQGLASAITTPLTVIAFVLLYYDIRIRKEGFDVEMLANSMGVTPPSQPVSAAPAQTFTPGTYNPGPTDPDDNPYQRG